jgi:hypothetical protein
MLNRGSPSKGRIRGSYSPSPVHSTPHESSNSGGGGGDHAAVSDDDDQKGGGDEDIDVGSTYVGLRSLEDEIERARVMVNDAYIYIYVHISRPYSHLSCAYAVGAYSYPLHSTH